MTAPFTLSDWTTKAAALTPDGRGLIDGQRVDALSGEVFASHSPMDGRQLAQIARMGDADVERAVQAARRSFDSGVWADRPPAERKRVLQNFALLIEQHGEELSLLETLDMGKMISDSVDIDLPAVVDCVSWFAESIDKVYDEVAPTAKDVVALVTREALGVVAAVVPWNFPMLMAMWKVAPALATGNSVVLKPAEQSSLTALRLADLALAAGLPPGVFNVVTGMGPEVGRALGLHMDVDGLFFTGSTRVGRIFSEHAAQSNLKKVGLELGGKSPNLILSSCHDVAHAARVSAEAAFFNQGEMCTCPSRLIVERSVRDEVVETLKAVAAEFIPGNPLDPNTTMGALVDETHAARVMGFVDTAHQDGARVIAGGERKSPVAGGSYVAPTIFDDVTNDMRIAQEEIFGPMLSVITVDDVSEAVRVANDTVYGLASAVWTDDLSVAHQVSKQIRAGLVYVNCYDCDDMTTPFGGFKQSGSGRDKSLHALDKYTELKTTWIQLSPGRAG
ncbi:aldehyde dehydrogenase [Shimia sp.]|uniref:aldehyde dehydrogenase n=1 Tax=Shimia sp. TaxID=1954381 RepID=UPI003BAC6822